MLKHSSNKEKTIELINNNPNPYSVLKESGRVLKSEYKRPPKRNGKSVVEQESRGLSMYVSNVTKARAGNNLHQGEWVLIRFEVHDNRYIVGYKSDGVAGNFDKRKSFSLSEATPEKIINTARDYLKGSLGVL